MKNISVTVEIKAPRERAFRAFTDFETSPKILHSATATEFLSEHREGLGTQWRQTCVDDGTTTVGIHTITEFEPPVRYVMTSDDEQAFERMEFRFIERPDSTIVTFSVSATPKKLRGKLILSLLRPLIREAVDKDLTRMKESIESMRD